MGNASAFIIFNTGDRSDVERLGKDIGLSSVAVEAILHYPRPDHLSDQKYSEFCYFYKDPVKPICGTVRYVQLAESDVGKVIGRQGRTARALRALLSAAGHRAHKRYTLEIIE